MKWKRTILGLTALLAISTLVGGILLYKGIIHINTPSYSLYPVRGVDVSSYQGKIDWDVLAAQNLSFAFIKATEGSKMVDDYFSQNYAGAIRAGLRVGAYHFLSYDSSGITQAENFIATVPYTENSLPPVVDVEFYGEHAANYPAKEHVISILQDILPLLEQAYHLKPILYVTRTSYNLYIREFFPDYDLWVRDTYLHPSMTYAGDWTFWQYSATGRLDGYVGEEDHIDLNVFNGSVEEFSNYAIHS